MCPLKKGLGASFTATLHLPASTGSITTQQVHGWTVAVMNGIAPSTEFLSPGHSFLTCKTVLASSGSESQPGHAPHRCSPHPGGWAHHTLLSPPCTNQPNHISDTGRKTPQPTLQSSFPQSSTAFLLLSLQKTSRALPALLPDSRNR